MVAKSSQTSKEFIDYRFNEMDKKLDRIEKKMDGFQFAKQAQVDELEGKLNVLVNDVTSLKQRFRPVEKIYYLVGGSLVTGIIGLGFWLLQKGLSK